MIEHDLSSDAMADRVNCFLLEPWLAALADHGGVAFNVPLDKGRERVDVSIVKLGLTVTLFVISTTRYLKAIRWFFIVLPSIHRARRCLLE